MRGSVLSNHDADSWAQKLLHTVVPNRLQKNTIHAPVSKDISAYESKLKDIGSKIKGINSELNDSMHWLKKKTHIEPQRQQNIASMLRKRARKERTALENQKGNIMKEMNENGTRQPGSFLKAGRYFAGQEGDDFILSHAATRTGLGIAGIAGVADVASRIAGPGTTTRDNRGNFDIAGVPFV